MRVEYIHIVFFLFLLPAVYFPPVAPVYLQKEGIKRGKRGGKRKAKARDKGVGKQ